MGKTLVLGYKENSKIPPQLPDAEFATIPVVSLGEEGERKLSKFVFNNIDGNVDDIIVDVDSCLSPKSYFSPEYFLFLILSIRLSLYEIKRAALAPIMLLTNMTHSIFKGYKYSNVILTGNIYIDELENLEKAVEVMKPLEAGNYKRDFLDKIKVMPNAREGHHSIANQWGADVLSRVALGENLRNESIARACQSMYFKYVRVQTLNVDELEKVIGDGNRVAVSAKPQKIGAKGKKVLLIDDEADKGWEDVLKKWFDGSDLEVICEQVSDYESLSQEARQKIEKGDYDLIFLDLRMNGSKEESHTKPKDFSGMKILKKIKELNKGTQVIMLTASNKVWNMRALLDAGADGYYVKESPEYAFSIEDSKSNAEKLRETIEECFSKGYLRKIWPRINDVKELIGRFDGDEKEGNWIKESLLGIDVAFDLLARSNDGNRYREFAFLQLFVPIERYVKDSNIIRKMGDCFYICKGKGLGYKIAWKVDNGSNYSNKYKSAISFVGGKYVFKTDYVSEKVCGETNFRVSSILIYKFGKENSSCHKWTEIYEKRNKIAHGEKCEILDEDFEKIIGFMNFFFDTYTDNVRWRDSPENLPNYAEQLAGAGFFVKTSRKGGR